MDDTAEIREELELFLQGATTLERQAEIKALLEQNAAWQKVYLQVQRDKQGIRFDTLTRLKQNLSAYDQSLTPEEKNPENISTDAGDLSTISAPPDDRPTKQAEVSTSMIPTPAEPDDLTRQGIRYHALRMVQAKLEEEEKKFSGDNNDKQKLIVIRKGKFLYTRLSVMALAACIIAMLFYFDLFTLFTKYDPNFKPYIYQGENRSIEYNHNEINKGIKYYINGNYNKAYFYLNNYDSIYINNDIKLVYISTLIKLKKYKRAKLFIINNKLDTTNYYFKSINYYLINKK